MSYNVDLISKKIVDGVLNCSFKVDGSYLEDKVDEYIVKRDVPCADKGLIYGAFDYVAKNGVYRASKNLTYESSVQGFDGNPISEKSKDIVVSLVLPDFPEEEDYLTAFGSAYILSIFLNIFEYYVELSIIHGLERVHGFNPSSMYVAESGTIYL